MVQTGSQLIIQSKWEAEFAQAPPAVLEAFLDLKNRHVKEYQSVLRHLCHTGSADTTGLPDVRADGEGNAEEPWDGRQEDVVAPAQLETQEFDSKAALPSLCVDCKSLEKGVMILRDEKFNTYLLSTTDRALPAHTLLGGFGSGSWQPRDLSIVRAVFFL